RPDDTYLGDVFIRKHALGAGSRCGFLKRGPSSVEIAALDGEGDVVDQTALVERLDDHIDAHPALGERTADITGDARSIGDFQDRQPRLISVYGHAAHRAVDFHLISSF